MLVKKIAILINRRGSDLVCWEQALHCAHAIMRHDDLALHGVFITGHSVEDVVVGNVPEQLLARVRQLAAGGIPLMVCRSRLPDDEAVVLPMGFEVGGLGQWMCWLEAADYCLEWA